MSRSQGSGPAKVSEGAGGGVREMRRVLNRSLLAARLASAASTSASHRAIFLRADGGEIAGWGGHHKKESASTYI